MTGTLDLGTQNINVDTNKGFVNSGSWTRNQTPYGYIDFGPANSGHAHIYTDRGSFYFNKELLVNGGTVWHSGNDGSGSGLDADLLDGQHASAFEPANGTILKRGDDITSQDWNTYVDNTEASWRTVTNHTGANRPSSAYTYGTALSFAEAGQARFQLYAPETSSSGGTTAGLWYRTGWNTNYRPWVRIWDSGNDGSGSGLDADLLDGQQGSYYYSSGNPPPLTADPTLTLTGDVTGSATFTNLGNATLTATVLDDSHTHSQVFIPDTRGAQRAPSYYPDKNVSFDFQQNTDTLAGGDSWNVLQTVAPWSVYDSTHRQQQLAWTGTGGLKFRYATSESAWAGWQTLWTSGNGGSGSGLDADTVDGVQAASMVQTTGTQTITDQKFFRSDRNTTSNSPPLQAYSSGAGGAIMSFHRSGYYAINMGLDSDNWFRIGGWSAANNRLQMDMSGNLTMAGNITAYSDIRLKENIKVIPDALSKVQQLRGVTFTRNDTEDLEKLHTGVIAQEVEAVLPEAVSEDNDGIKNVAYGNMVGLLIESIKELKTEVDNLKTQLENK